MLITSSSKAATSAKKDREKARRPLSGGGAKGSLTSGQVGSGARRKSADRSHAPPRSKSATPAAAGGSPSRPSPTLPTIGGADGSRNRVERRAGGRHQGGGGHAVSVSDISSRLLSSLEGQWAFADSVTLLDQRMLDIDEADVMEAAVSMRKALFGDVYKKVRKLQLTRDDMSLEISEKTDVIEESRQREEKMERKIALLEGSISELQSKLKFTESSLQNSRMRTEDLERENTHISSLLAAYKEADEKDPTALRAIAAERGVEIAEMKQTLRSLQQKDDTKTSTISHLEGTVRNLQAEVDALEEKDERSIERQRSLESAVRNLQSRCAALDAEGSGLREQVEKLEKEKKGIEFKLERESHDHRHLQKQYLTVREEMLSKAQVEESVIEEEKRLRERIHYLQEEVGRVVGVTREQQKSIEELEKRLDDRDNELREAYKKKAEADTALLKLQSRQVTKQSTVNKILTQISEKIPDAEWIGQTEEGEEYGGSTSHIYASGQGGGGDVYRPSTPPRKRASDRDSGEEGEEGEDGFGSPYTGSPLLRPLD